MDKWAARDQERANLEKMRAAHEHAAGATKHYPELQQEQWASTTGGVLTGSLGPEATGARMSARNAILDRAVRLEKEAHGLRALVRGLPEELPPGADDALWLLMGARV